LAIKEKEEIDTLPPIETAGLTIFILILIAGVFSTIFGFPGTFIVLLDVIAYSSITGFKRIGFTIILALVIISLVAEAADFFLGLKGAKKYVPTKKGVIASLAGGSVGAILMTPILLGLGTLLGIFLGGFFGVFLLECLEERKLKPSFRSGFRALLGRVTGVLFKGLSAIVMTIITMSAIYS
jgi:uncharacterized protein YqgC (DUF456 family)